MSEQQKDWIALGFSAVCALVMIYLIWWVLISL